MASWALSSNRADGTCVQPARQRPTLIETPEPGAKKNHAGPAANGLRRVGPGPGTSPLSLKAIAGVAPPALQCTTSTQLWLATGWSLVLPMFRATHAALCGSPMRRVSASAAMKVEPTNCGEKSGSNG